MSTQARKWHIVWNTCPFGRDEIIERIMRCKPRYACFSLEAASSTGTLHYHIFLFAAPIRFTTLKRRFPGAHIEVAYGTAKENRAYITKNC